MTRNVVHACVVLDVYMYQYIYIYIYRYTKAYIHTYIHTYLGSKSSGVQGSRGLQNRSPVCMYVCMYVCELYKAVVACRTDRLQQVYVAHTHTHTHTQKNNIFSDVATHAYQSLSQATHTSTLKITHTKKRNFSNIINVFVDIPANA
jgi:hypothetical protein